MQYPSRNADEASYVKRLERLSSSQRAQLRRLVGYPPKPENVPASFWREVAAEAERENVIALYLMFLNSAEFHLGGADDDARDRLRQSGDVDAAGNAFADALAAGMGQRWGETAEKRWNNAADVINRSIEPGAPSALTKADVEELLVNVFSPDDAAGAAAYGATSAESAGGETAAKETYGITAEDQWQTNPHLTRTGPCERCKAEDGKPRKDWSQRYPSGPPIHEYCVLPGQIAKPLGRLIGGVESLYDGPCVEITTASGRRITVTENHPVLTPDGWIAAHLLLKSGYILGSPDIERLAVAVANPNDHHAPAPIEEIFHSFRVSVGVVSARVPTAAEAFHGDGRFIDGDIHVVRADGKLRDYVQAEAAQHLGKRQFAGRHRAGVDFPFASDGAIGGVATIPTKLRGGLNAAAFDAESYQLARQRGARDANFSGEQVFRLASPITLGDGCEVGEWLPSLSLDAGISDPAAKQRDANASLAREFLRRFAGQIACDEIIKVRRFQYAGHVYDLSVDPWRLFLVDGAIVSNCACTLNYANFGQSG